MTQEAQQVVTPLAALKLALEALELHGKQYPHMVKGYCLDAITAVKEALAQPEQDKERCVGCEACIDTACGRDECPKGWPKAPQRTWVGLTDEEVKKIAYNTAERKVAKDIEAKLKEKNDC